MAETVFHSNHTRGMNHQDIREFNRKLVLKLLYMHKGLSIAQLSKYIGLSIPAVSKIVDDLKSTDNVDIGYANHRGRGHHRGTVRITRCIPNTICLNISPEKLSAIALNNEMTPVCGLQNKSIHVDSSAELVEQILALIIEIATRTGIEHYRLALAVHGQVDINSGASLCMPHAKWKESFELKYILQNRLSVEVLVDNDCVMLALAEKWLHNNAARDFCVLNISFGIGSSFLIHGEIYRGPHFGSGQIGHSFIGHNGRICHCGREGCLETESSVPAMCERFSALKNTTMTFSDLVNAYDNNDQDALTVVLDAAKYIGVTLYNFLVTLDINKIVLYGETDCFGQPWLETITKETMYNPFDPCLQFEKDATSISFGTLTEEEKLIGIGYLWVEKELELIGKN